MKQRQIKSTKCYFFEKVKIDKPLPKLRNKEGRPK